MMLSVRIPDLPAIRQQLSLTSPHAAPCGLDAISVVSSVDVGERVDEWWCVSGWLVNGMQGVRGFKSPQLHPRSTVLSTVDRPRIPALAQHRPVVCGQCARPRMWGQQQWARSRGEGPPRGDGAKRPAAGGCGAGPLLPAEKWGRPAVQLHRARLLRDRRLVKVIGGCLASVPDLSVVWAVLDPTSHGWRGLSVTQTATAAAGSAPPAPPTTCREGGDRPSYPRCRMGITVTLRPEPLTPLVRCHRCSHGHDLCQWPLGHPSLFHWSLHALLDEGGVGGQVGELQPARLKADHGAGASPGFELVGEEVDAAGRQSGGLDPVEGAGIPALLDVAEDGLAGVEQLPPLLFKQRGEEAGGVDRVGVLAADN